MRVLFICTRNAIRSPMAESLARAAFPALDVDSAGVDPDDIDGFAISVMAEVGQDLQRHEAKDLRHIADFDLIIALSPTAARVGAEMLGDQAHRMEVWDIPDPSGEHGNREQRLVAYRHVRDSLTTKIKARFAT